MIRKNSQIPAGALLGPRLLNATMTYLSPVPGAEPLYGAEPWVLIPTHRTPTAGNGTDRDPAAYSGYHATSSCGRAGCSRGGIS